MPTIKKTTWLRVSLFALWDTVWALWPIVNKLIDQLKKESEGRDTAQSRIAVQSAMSAGVHRVEVKARKRLTGKMRHRK